MKRHSILTLAAVIVAAIMTSNCTNPQSKGPNTLLTKRGQRELGVSGLRVQCAPNNNGLSIYTEENESISFFSAGVFFSFLRTLNNVQRPYTHAYTITQDDTLRSAQKLADSLNAFCMQIKSRQKQFNRYDADSPTPPPPQPKIVYEVDGTGAEYLWENQTWVKDSALEQLEQLRKLAEKIRKDQANTYSKRGRGQDRTLAR